MRIFIVSFFLLNLANAATWKKESSEKATLLLELYSSEGCSSCPPADEWMASLRTHKGLWKNFVPIEFHVDYWNRLGWHDKFSRSEFTARQRQYSKLWGSRTVYTPGFVLNGKEWTRSMMNLEKRIENAPKVGKLSVVETSARNFEVQFTSSVILKNPRINAAVLGNGFESKVSSGENSGKTLRHEFVVVSLESSTMKEAGKNTSKGNIVLKVSDGEAKAKSLSLAFWVSAGESPTPIQSVGGDF